MPNADLSQTSVGNTLNCLNDALEQLFILPVHNLDNIVGGSDQFWVYQRMIRIHRNLQMQGWYCFNREFRYAPEYVTDRYEMPANTVAARTARRLPTDPLWPEVRLERPESGNPYLLRLDREFSGTTEFQDSERTLLVDATFNRSIDEAPEVYRAYLAALTAEEMAPKFSAPIIQGYSRAYLEKLQIFEGDYEPKGNVFNDEYYTLKSWIR